MKIEDGTRATILIHYYRAMVGRADIWRMRMDTTTNWAIGTTAAVTSFALGDRTSPHYVVYIAAFLTVIFLLLEARRLTFYHLWQQRALILERGLIARAAAVGGAESSATVALDELEAELTPHLGATAPTMPLTRAAARRLRRVYVYLFATQALAWLVKLSTHPSPLESPAELVPRAAVGALPGTVVLGLSLAGLGVAVVLAGMAGSGRR